MIQKSTGMITNSPAHILVSPRYSSLELCGILQSWMTWQLSTIAIENASTPFLRLYIILNDAVRMTL